MKFLFRPLSATFATAAFAMTATATLKAEDTNYRIYTTSNEAVQLYSFSSKTSKLTLSSSSPLPFNGRILALHPKLPVLYVNGSKGTKRQLGASFTAACVLKDDGSIESVNPMAAAIAACALATDHKHNFLIGASYRSGEVEVHAIDGKGLITSAPRCSIPKEKQHPTFASASTTSTSTFLS